MNRTLLGTYRVADLLEWFRDDRLELNPDFQRGEVWGGDARSYLIDSLLRGYPIPKVFLRTKVNRDTQKTIREVVDGQQRLRAIIDFANSTLRLTKRASEYSGLTYADLDDELQEGFLGYSVSVEQLIGADDDDVLEVFARLNTYTVPLSPQEQRHAKYGGEFKFAARSLSTQLRPFFDKYRLFTLYGRVRMLNDQLAAEMLAVLIHGVKNAGKQYLDEVYAAFDAEFPETDEQQRRAAEVVATIDARLSRVMQDRFFARPPQFLMLFASVAAVQFGIPKGDLSRKPARNGDAINWAAAEAALLRLASAVARDDPPRKYVPFVQAVGGATTRIASRKVRFSAMHKAITSG